MSKFPQPTVENSDQGHVRFFIFLLRLSLAALLICTSRAAIAADDDHSWNPEVGVFTGPFLISHAQLIMPSAGGRLSFSPPTNIVDYFEFQGFGANVGGVSYYLGQAGIRNEFKFERITGLFLFGFDWHYIRSKSASAYSATQGWHIGTGLNVELSNKLFFRNDYVMRFGGRRSLLVTVGFSWAFGGSES